MKQGIGMPIASVILDILSTHFTERNSISFVARGYEQYYWVLLDSYRLEKLRLSYILKPHGYPSQNSKISRATDLLAGIQTNDFRRSSIPEGEKETVFHLMCQ